MIRPHCAEVNVQGVPMMSGVVDSGADITIMGGEMFKCVHVATIAKLKFLNLLIRHPIITTSSLAV